MARKATKSAAVTAAKPKAAKRHPKSNPGPTPEQQMIERVAKCRELLEGHWTKGEIKRWFFEQHKVTARTVESYLKSAREEMLLEIADTRDFHRSQSLSLYRSILKNESASLKDKIIAQRQIDHLLGLHAPWKVAQTDAQGRDLPPDEARDRLSALASGIAERIRKAGVDRLSEGGRARTGVNGSRSRKRKASE